LQKNRVYRVRPDIPPANATADIASELGDNEGTAQEIYAQYHRDWQEWPWRDGAPYIDVDGNGMYEPNVDLPGIGGASQTLWYAANDMLKSYSGWGLYPSAMGIEMQQTIWAYAREGALGNVIFRRSRLINKGTKTLDSMFVSLFVDADLGNSADDLTGCDTTRSLAFIYNANEYDEGYKALPPPAVGFDFFQGPIVPGSAGDSAIFEGRWIHGKHNLPMTAAYSFAYGDDPANSPAGIPQWYNYIRGLMKSGKPYVDPNGVATNFPYAGDPEKRTGWLDTFPYDKRFGLCSGPFTMAPGDTQEVVIAEIAAGATEGVGRLSAVGLLKFYDDQAQRAYNDFFQVPNAPPGPMVTASALDGGIILSWGNDPGAVDSTESSNTLGYAFEGYNVYQLPSTSSSLDQALRLRTFDIVNDVRKIVDPVYDPEVGMTVPRVVQFGDDSGIERSLTLTTDPFNSDLPLVNGTKYYYAVTAYNYNPSGISPTSLESSPIILTVVPHSPNPGTRYAGKNGDTVKTVTHTTAPGATSCDGSVVPLVVDPTKLTGHLYSVTFDTVVGVVSWKLTDQTTGKILLANQTNQSGDDNYLFADGIQVKVVGALPGMASWSIPSGTRRLSPAGGGGLGYEGFSSGSDPNAPQDPANGTIGMGANFPYAKTTLKVNQYRNVLLRLAAVDNQSLWDPKATPADTNFSRAYRYLRNATSAPAQPGFAPWIVNASPGYAYQDFNYSVPLSAWDMETNPPTRLAIGHLENNDAAGLVDGRWWPALANTSGVDVNVGPSTPREWLFIFATPYSTTPDPAYQINLSGASVPLMWGTTCVRRAEVAWAAGDQFMINANHVNYPGNTFTFTAPQNTVADPTLAKEDINKINVFPNPYYGVNPQETNKYLRFVTFSHLPEHAVICIFNLAGVMVRKIDRTSASQFEQWDLKNQEGLPVGSGLYIAHIEMPELGTTKILKVAVVQEQQILDRY
jgi:hypothetical protein